MNTSEALYAAIAGGTSAIRLHPHVVVAVRCHAERNGWIHPDLNMWLVSLAGETRCRISVRSVFGAPNPAASANFAAVCFLTEYTDADWLCIVDNDCVPPLGMMQIIAEAPRDADIIGGISHMCQDGLTGVQAGWGGLHRGEEFHPVQSEPRALYEVDRVGGCCWFIHSRVFALMDKPYFKEVLDEETQMIIVSDDIYFQAKAKALGCRIYCDTRFVTEHYHTQDLST